ncbi:CoA-binding protein [Gammaproteobacteria bacterium]|nr:CoA-binding protein [Gammaproteobacteria bacterium]
MNKENLKSILNDVKTIAIVGASLKPERDSYKVMKFLIESGYEVYPVNPNYADNQILGKKCFSNLKDIDQKIDMVDVFRPKEFVNEITEDAIKAGVKVIWTQEGIIDYKSSFMAKNMGIKFVMDECPMKVLMN